MLICCVVSGHIVHAVPGTHVRSGKSGVTEHLYLLLLAGWNPREEPRRAGRGWLLVLHAEVVPSGEPFPLSSRGQGTVAQDKI